MKKLFIVALAATLALILSGCELITGNDTSSNSSGSTNSTPSVHGAVILTSSGPLPSGAKLQITVTTVTAVAQARILGSTTYTKNVPVSASGTFSYVITGVADGTYTVTVGLLDGSNSPQIKPVTLGSNVMVSGGSASVPDIAVSYSAT